MCVTKIFFCDAGTRVDHIFFGDGRCSQDSGVDAETQKAWEDSFAPY